MKHLSLITMLCVVLANGCSSLGTLTSAMKPKQHGNQPVADILGLWQSGEGRDVNGLPTRGFAGQVFFFKTGSRQPVAVEGDVSVVVFDDQGSVEEQKKPIHEFHFRGGVWDQFRQDTNLGPAYQLFIPYTRQGSHQANCSVRIKYSDADGQELVSEAATVLLVGDTVPKQVAEMSKKANYPGRHLRAESIMAGTSVESLSRSAAMRSLDGEAMQGVTRPHDPLVNDRATTAAYQFLEDGSVPQRSAIPGRATTPQTTNGVIEQASYRLRPARNQRPDVQSAKEPTRIVEPAPVHRGAAEALLRPGAY